MFQPFFKGTVVSCLVSVKYMSLVQQSILLFQFRNLPGCVQPLCMTCLQCGCVGSSGEQLRQHEKSLQMLLQERKGKRPLTVGDFMFLRG